MPLTDLSPPSLLLLGRRVNRKPAGGSPAVRGRPRVRIGSGIITQTSASGAEWRQPLVSPPAATGGARGAEQDPQQPLDPLLPPEDRVRVGRRLPRGTEQHTGQPRSCRVWLQHGVAVISVLHKEAPQIAGPPEALPSTSRTVEFK